MAKPKVAQVGERTVTIVNRSGVDVSISVNNKLIPLPDNAQHHEVLKGRKRVTATGPRVKAGAPPLVADETWDDQMPHDHTLVVGYEELRGKGRLTIDPGMSANS